MAVEPILDEQVAAIGFAAIGHPSRLGLVRVLASCTPHSRTAGQLAKHLGLGASTLSGHLAKLRAANLITMQRRGTSLHYALHPEGLAGLAQYIELGSAQALAPAPTPTPTTPKPTTPKPTAPVKTRTNPCQI